MGRRAVPASPADWLAHAESDLNLARLAKDREDILPEQVCFHAQQAAEKALKAVLLSRGIEFPLVHDIEVLVRLAEGKGIALPAGIADASALTPYAIEARYPGYPEEISSTDVHEAIHLAERVVAWAVATIPTQEAKEV